MADTPKTDKVSKITKKKTQAPETPKEPEVDPMLLGLVGSMEALVSINNLLNEGAFQVVAHPSVRRALKYVKDLHESVTTQAMAHPQCDMIADLRKMKQENAARIQELKELEAQMGAK